MAAPLGRLELIRQLVILTEVAPPAGLAGLAGLAGIKSGDIPPPTKNLNRCIIHLSATTFFQRKEGQDSLILCLWRSTYTESTLSLNHSMDPLRLLPQYK